jgi:hypothetical protein
MQYYPAKILIHFKSSKVKIAINNKYIINYKIKSKNNASLVFVFDAVPIGEVLVG